MLTEFIKFLRQCVTRVSEPADKKLQQENAWKLLEPQLSLTNTLLSRPPASSMQQHAEERNALVLLTSLATPSYVDGLDHDYIVDWARSLMRRGAADINARAADGTTSAQNWCSSNVMNSAKGILMLLDAGADLDATHPRGWTVLYQLCYFSRLEVLRELSEAGWLEMANIDLPGVGGETPIAYLQRKLREKPDDSDATEMLELLSAQKDLWASDVRPAILAQLGVHEPLIPVLAEMMVSYIDGGKMSAAVTEEVAAAAASSS